MSDSLHPLRLAYGLADRPPETGPAAEEELLRQMRRLLNAAPRQRPTPETVATVESAAAEAGAHGALRAALDGAADGTEAELIRQSLAALDSLPADAPDASTLDAILAAAADASAPLAPIRAAYGLGDAASDSVELAMLTQTRAALDASRVEQRPDASAVDAVLARAADWSARDESIPASAPDLAAVYGAAAVASVPAALMAGAADALDRLPTVRPSDDALAAVFAAAATATRESQSAPVATTPAVPLGGARPIASPTATAPAATWARRPAVWGSAAAMLAAVAIVVNLFGSEPPVATEVASFVEEAPAAVADEPPAEAESFVAALPPPPPAPEPAPISSGAAALARGGPMAGAPSTSSPLQPRAVLGAPPVRSAAPRARSTTPASRSTQQLVRAESAPVPQAQTRPAPTPRRQAAPAADLSVAAFAATPADDSASKTGADAWEAGEDVRLLSLRLQELRRQNQGLEWDDAEAFGAPEAVGGASATRGVQSVGMGRMSGVPAARARALVDSTIDR